MKGNHSGVTIFTDLPRTENFFKDFSYLFLERGEGREKETKENFNVRGKHQLLTFARSPTGGQAPNPDVCPDRESNWQHLTLRDNVQLSVQSWPRTENFNAKTRKASGKWRQVFHPKEH